MASERRRIVPLRSRLAYYGAVLLCPKSSAVVLGEPYAPRIGPRTVSALRYCWASHRCRSPAATDLVVCSENALPPWLSALDNHPRLRKQTPETVGTCRGIPRRALRS
ncbi:hypothetical protein PF001_g20576 [Phytophthora fragariae]|uniref:Uncharacterized protein n=1 Tax=Phytophthora fragariae TaxID=53985 RepID=A0A6A4CKU3_9STRA|nr:hypothetical protein PF003_g23521 [Phytophthora fragariae]KAE9288307.1 hypothetical protein PF001_g20576 [Phytophthora fragariae]